MKFKVWTKCECGCGERTFMDIHIGKFKIRWFVDNYEWFFYIYLGKKYYRFSSVGFVNGKL